MLKHWHELFPGYNSPDAIAFLPDAEIKKQLYRLPTSWAHLARELCTAIEDPDGAICALYAVLCDAMHCASEEIWCSAWNAGLLDVLEEMMNDEYCCGFSRELLLSTDDGRKTVRLFYFIGSNDC